MVRIFFSRNVWTALLLTASLACHSSVSLGQYDHHDGTANAGTTGDSVYTLSPASIKPTRPGESNQQMSIQGGHRLRIINNSLLSLLEDVYSVHADQIISSTGWIKEKRFDIGAVVSEPGTPTMEQWRSMIEALLVDRFALRLHHETRELPVYLLGVASNGPRLSSTKDHGDLPDLTFHGQGHLKGTNATIADLARTLQDGALDRPVVDSTKLRGRFDFVLDFSQIALHPQTGDNTVATSASEPVLPDISTALREELGLTLILKRYPIDVIVIDKVSLPTPD